MSGPYEGIRIVDLSAMLAGPWATSILGGQGADVIKVEPPAGAITPARSATGAAACRPRSSISTATSARSRWT